MGHWRGKLAEIFGIEGHEVTTENFGALGNNKHPVTGEKLRPRSSKVSFHDVVISAPKSYSIAALVGKDERLIQGFQRAVKKTFQKLEEKIAVRDRSGQAYHTENFAMTGNGAAAVFLHDDNRLLDPQVHMHVVFSNHSFHPERGQFLALQPKIMMDEAKRWITDQFHRELAKEAMKAGYEVELPGDRLRLTGVGLKLEYKFSKRAQQRRKFEKRYRNLFGHSPDAKRIEYFIKEGRAAARQRFQREYQGAFGRSPTRELMDSFVVDWRSQKKTDIGDLEKHLYQRQQLTSLDAKRLDRLVEKARKRSQVSQESKTEIKLEETQIPSLDEVSHSGGEQRVLINGKEEHRSQKNQRRKSSREKRGHQVAIGRIEAIRRMRRGMAISQALRGHPMVFMLQQVSRLTQKR